MIIPAMRAFHFLLHFLTVLTLYQPPVAGLGATGSAHLPAGLVSRYRRESGSWGIVYHRGWTRENRSIMASRISESLERLEERIGRKRGRPFTVILTPERQDFTRIFQVLTSRRPERWISGVAFPGRDLLLVAGDALWLLKSPGDRPSVVLEHEIAHLIIHARRGSRIPRWFDEGVAMWASRKVLEPGDEAFLSGLARIGALHSLEALEGEIPHSHNLASIAYQQSLLVVEWLARNYGPDLVGDLLARLDGGSAFPEALRDRTGLEMAELESRFVRWLKGRRSIWEALASIVNLWTVVSLLALVAIARYLLRRRRLLRKMEEEEGGE